MAYTPNQIFMRHRKNKMNNIRRMVSNKDEKKKRTNAKKWLEKARNTSTKLAAQEIINEIDVETHEQQDGSVAIVKAASEPNDKPTSPSSSITPKPSELKNQPMDSANFNSRIEGDTTKMGCRNDIKNTNEKYDFPNIVGSKEEQKQEALVMGQLSPSFKLNNDPTDSVNDNRTVEKTVGKTSCSTDIEEINQKHNFPEEVDNEKVHESLIRQLSSPSSKLSSGPMDSVNDNSQTEKTVEKMRCSSEIEEKYVSPENGDDEKERGSLITQLSSPSFELDKKPMALANGNSTIEGNIKNMGCTAEIEATSQKYDFPDNADTNQVQESLMRQLTNLPSQVAPSSFEINNGIMESANDNNSIEEELKKMGCITEIETISEKNEFFNNDNKKKIDALPYERLLVTSHHSSNDKKDENKINKKRDLPKVIANVQTKLNISQFLKQRKKKRAKEDESLMKMIRIQKNRKMTGMRASNNIQKHYHCQQRRIIH